MPCQGHVPLEPIHVHTIQTQWSESLRIWDVGSVRASHCCPGEMVLVRGKTACCNPCEMRNEVTHQKRELFCDFCLLRLHLYWEGQDTGIWLGKSLPWWWWVLDSHKGYTFTLHKSREGEDHVWKTILGTHWRHFSAFKSKAMEGRPCERKYCSSEFHDPNSFELRILCILQVWTVVTACLKIRRLI